MSDIIVALVYIKTFGIKDNLRFGTHLRRMAVSSTLSSIDVLGTSFLLFYTIYIIQIIFYSQKLDVCIGYLSTSFFLRQKDNVTAQKYNAFSKDLLAISLAILQQTFPTFLGLICLTSIELLR